jgi:hypothetical protein
VLTTTARLQLRPLLLELPRDSTRLIIHHLESDVEGFLYLSGVLRFWNSKTQSTITNEGTSEKKCNEFSAINCEM